MCDLLRVSTSGYYAWLKRAPSKRASTDRVLTDLVYQLWKDSKRSYGAPRIHADLVDAGYRVGRKRVARLMRNLGIRGITRRRYRRRPATDHTRPYPDLVRRVFRADDPNTIWVADITEIPTREGLLYLAVVMDVWSRRVVGWGIEPHMRTELVTAALEMAINQRNPTRVVHHSDQGAQYTSIAFGLVCWNNNVVPSMGSVGDCYDNAMAESFFATVECEFLTQTVLTTRKQAKQELFTWIEGWYNTHRRHSSIGNQSPAHYEERNWPS